MSTTSGGAARLGRWRPGPLAAAIGLAGVSVFPAFLAGAVSVQLRLDLDLGPAQFGSAVSAYFAASALSVAALGRAVDRVGERRGYLLGAGLAIVSLAGIAGLARSWIVLAAFLAAGGVGNAIVGPTSSRLLAMAIAPGRRGMAFGVKQAAIMAATLLGGVGVPVLAVTFGWRWVYVAGALIACSLFAMTPRVRLRAEPSEGVVGTGRQLPQTLVLLALAFGLGTSASVAMTTFLVDYAVTRGISEGGAGTLLAGGSAGAIVIRLVLGWWTDRGMPSAEHAIAVIFLVGAVAMAALAWSGPALLVPVAIVAFTFSWGWTGLLVYVVAVNNLSSPASATGLVQTGAAIGGVLGPSALGLVAERASYQAMWLTGAAMLLGAASSMMTAIALERRRGAAAAVSPSGGRPTEGQAPPRPPRHGRR